MPIGDEKEKLVAVNVTDLDPERVDELLGPRDTYAWLPSRALLGLPSMKQGMVAEVQAVVRAVSLLAWHMSVRFGGTDGRPTLVKSGYAGRRRETASGRTMYPRVEP